MTTTYVRSSGGHVAERERPAEGSDRERELSRLAEDPASEWRAEGGPVADAEPKRPPKSGSKAAWVAYAVSQGLDEAESDAMKREDLAALFEESGGTPDGGDQ